MPNQSSHAHNVPQRTCVVCGTSKDLGALLSVVVWPEGVVFDPGRKLQQRRNYVCQRTECLVGLDKWLTRYRKRRFATGGGSVKLFSAVQPEVSEGISG